jgi:GNAT superfamily N-acetyltransferase
MTLRIRAAGADDIHSLAQFQVAMARETESLELNPHQTLEGVRAVIHKSNPAAAVGRYYIAEDSNTGAAAGCTLVQTEWSDWRNGTVWWIHSVYVKPEFRKIGVFKAIYEHLKQEVTKSPDLRGLRLFVDRTNLPAQNVYQKLGMNGDHYRLFEWMKEY